jgi:hypothetical protein
MQVSGAGYVDFLAPSGVRARRLQFLTDDKTLPARQLWGAVFGVLA